MVNRPTGGTPPCKKKEKRASAIPHGWCGNLSLKVIYISDKPLANTDKLKYSYNVKIFHKIRRICLLAFCFIVSGFYGSKQEFPDQEKIQGGDANNSANHHKCNNV